MQSGISVSPSLHSAFASFTSDSSKFALLVRIASEQLEAVTTLPTTGSTFYDSLSTLAPHLTPTQPLYLILRRDFAPSAAVDAFVAVTYIPDTAPVRQKTLFASTRLTLVRDLGSEKFRESVFVTEADELTAEGWRKHERHVAGENPLTEEERVLKDVKDAEGQETAGGTTARRSHVSSGVALKVADDAAESLRALGREQHGDNLVQLKINVGTETITLASTDTVTPTSLSSAISPSEPRYSFYRYTVDDSSQSPSPIVFIYTCPTASKIKERMLYATSRAGVLAYAKESAGLDVDKKLEATAPDEIDASTLESEFHPKQETKHAFARPRRPGRR